jgi:streptogramin lyase
VTLQKTVFAVCLVAGLAGVALSARQAPAALTGVVSSQEEGAMEGVLVSARRAGSTITTTVVSDAQGRYSFPRARLEPGTYTIRIRAVGYELDGPASATLAGHEAARADLKLRKTQDLASQLSNGEWLMSWPGSDEMKQNFLSCTQCHGLQPLVRSRYTAGQLAPIIDRMARYAQGSTMKRPQLRPNTRGGAVAGPVMGEAADTGREGERPASQSRTQAMAAYAATVNLSSGPHWSYALTTLPRPTGKATRVIVTEYSLPRPETLPHDAVADADGNIWYADFGTHVLGMLDPKTGAVTEHRIPITKPGAPEGSLDLVFDARGDIWLGTMYQGSLARFDRRAKTFQTWGSPTYRDRDEARIAMVMPIHAGVDGQVWIGGDSEYQVDVKTGQWKAIDYSVGLPPGFRGALSSYGVASDSKNHFYGMNLNGTYIIKVDAKTGAVTPYATPTPNSGPRRGHMDAQDRLWFAEFRGSRIAMFDTKAATFREWPIAAPWTNVYDVIADAAGYAWGGGMNNDLIARLNVRTGEMVEYLLPNATNVRRVNVDNSVSPPAFWVGNNLGATLIRVEPLE